MIRFFKKDTGVTSIKNYEPLEVALSYGWITGQSRPYDEISWLGRFTPRRPHSTWSKINTIIAERLIKECKMKPAGLFQVEAAKKDGRWERAYRPQRTAVLPADFEEEPNKNEKAKRLFKTLNKSSAYSLIFRVETSENKGQRKKRIHAIVSTLEKRAKSDSAGSPKYRAQWI